VNTIIIIKLVGKSLLMHESNDAFHSASASGEYSYQYHKHSTACLYCIQASPALRGPRALAREAHRADSRRALKKVCANQNNLDTALDSGNRYIQYPLSLIEAVQIFGQARLENLSYNHRRLIPISQALRGPFACVPKGRLA